MRTISDCVHALQGAIGTVTYVAIDRHVANDIIAHLNRLHAADGCKRTFKPIATYPNARPGDWPPRFWFFNWRRLFRK